MLPGVKDIIAENIIQYRESHNGFKYRSELKNVYGIGEKRYEEIKKYVRIR
jgi:competence protein ComEA